VRGRTCGSRESYSNEGSSSGALRRHPTLFRYRQITVAVVVPFSRKGMVSVAGRKGAAFRLKQDELAPLGQLNVTPKLGTANQVSGGKFLGP
jgi:hypothetical protein